MTPHEQRREAMARVLAAALMGLVKDPTGANLPEDLWKRMLPKADGALFLTTSDYEAEDDYHGPD